MKIIFGVWLACASGPVMGKVITCAPLLAIEHDRLAAGLRHALAVDAKASIDPVLFRLDQDILSWAGQELGKLSAGRRERALRVIERASLGRAFWNDHLKAHQKLEDAYGHLYLAENQVSLVIDAFETQSEASRFTLRHELTHLFRFVEAGLPAHTVRRAHRLLARPMGLALEEAYAARDDYRYLHRNYTSADIPRVRARIANLEEWIEAAIARGFLKRRSDLLVDIDVAFVNGAEDNHILFQILTAEADDRMLQRLERVFDLSEAEWIRAEIAQCR